MKFTIVFHDGSRIEDEAVNRHDVAEILRLQKARDAGQTHLTVGLAGGRLRTVGDVASIEVEAAGS